MPDSMTNVEMQDVLSSIRRLVSKNKETEKEVAVINDDRFLLTPAHRVEAADDSFAPDFVAHLRQPSEPFELTGRISEAVAPETDASVAPAKMPMSRDEGDQSSGLPPLGVQNPKATTLEMRIAELEVAVDQSGHDWEPDGSEPEETPVPGRHIFEVVDNTHFIQPREIQPPAPEVPLQLADVAVFTHFPAKSEASSGSAAPEQMGNETGSNVPTRTVPETRTMPPKDEPGPGELVDSNEDVFVDEDVLRRVVAEVVREELQGKMGERITRNVRRMVRREIEHTLSLKNFD
ncbi:MAG: hypothetical protein KUG69_08210 [Marinosulfonomonas sp.]|nr:hypothetical protein [Marinosulfonomonas sp.]